MKQPKSILFLGETYRADAQSWILGIEHASGIKIDTLEVETTPTRIGRIFNFLVFGLKILKTNFSKSYDLVLAERATSYGFFSLFVRAKKRIVAQQGITDAWPETGFSGVYKRFFQKLVYKNVDLIHAWGEVMVPAMLASKADPKKIMVLPKGIDLEKYQMGSEKLALNAIVTRSLTPVYHHADILEAVAILKEKGILIRLVLVGDGNLKSKLEKKCQDLKIKDLVKFTGRIPNTELPEYLQKAKIYISVPETEGVSASLFEAMACGCFPVVTDLPGTRAFIREGQNGFLVPVNSPEKIAEAIQKYLAKEDRFHEEVLANRKFIEDQVDLRKNMERIWLKYLSLLQNQTA
jgi:glycosyltransferase involved in cell wall biosynthesis